MRQACNPESRSQHAIVRHLKKFQMLRLDRKSDRIARNEAARNPIERASRVSVTTKQQRNFASLSYIMND